MLQVGSKYLRTGQQVANVLNRVSGVFPDSLKSNDQVFDLIPHFAGVKRERLDSELSLGGTD